MIISSKVHTNTLYTWYRHPFSKFPEFSPIKINFPDQRNSKCQVLSSGLSDSSSRLLSVINVKTFSFFKFTEKYCWDHSNPKCFFQLFNGSKSAVLIKIISIFPDFSSKCQFSLTLNKIPWLFPDLGEFFSPDYFLTCGNPGTCKHQFISLLKRLQNTK